VSRTKNSVLFQTLPSGENVLASALITAPVTPIGILSVEEAHKYYKQEH